MPKNRLTAEEFLEFRPRRKEFKWYKNSEGIVEVRVPKFKSKIGRFFCRLFKKNNEFIARFDCIGSVVWENCDGKKTVREILEVLKSSFPEEKNIDQRLYLFIRQIKHLGYIDYWNP